MDVSALTPDLSNVLTPDTLKAVGIIFGLFAAKWAIGKAWCVAKTTTKTLAASLSFIGVVSAFLLLFGPTVIGYGIGEIGKPKNTKLIVAYATSHDVNYTVLRAKLERRLLDQKTLTPEQYEKKWLGEGNEFMEDLLLPNDKPEVSFVVGSTCIGLGVGAIIVGVVAFFLEKV